MMRFSPLILTATGVLAVLPQETRRDPNKTTPPAAQREMTGHDHEADPKGTDEFLATWALIGSNNEIALAELAVQRASNPEVKQFAQKMIDDHRQMVQKLQAFASPMDIAMGERHPAPASDRPATTPPRETTPSAETPRAHEASASHGMAFHHTGLIRELGEQCLQSSRKELEQKQGADFDRCFMGMAVGAHMKANDELTVFQRHASTTLKPVLSESQRVVASHLEDAKSLAKKLETGTSTAAAAGSK
jgi:putative membrane protein